MKTIHFKSGIDLLESFLEYATSKGLSQPITLYSMKSATDKMPRPPIKCCQAQSGFEVPNWAQLEVVGTRRLNAMQSVGPYFAFGPTLAKVLKRRIPENDLVQHGAAHK